MSERMASKQLKEFAAHLGFQSIGICLPARPAHIEAYRSWISKGYHGSMSYLAEHLPLKEHPANLLPGVQSVIVCTLNYYQPLPSNSQQPKIARYALGRDYHKVLRSKLRALARYIEQENPEARCRPCVDSAPVMERDFAQQAGLGFFGKNTMLIDARRGSWFFIGVLLTTVSYAPDAPAIGGCGSCTKCIDACPTGAIVHEEGRWQLDARRCISYLTIEHQGEINGALKGRMADWTFGCDVCQEVCPFNEQRESQPLRSMDTAQKDFSDQKSFPSLKELAQIDYASWDELTRGSAIRRTGIEGLRRNARINLENGLTSRSDSK